MCSTASSGEPVWPIVERPVPTDTDVPGEKVWPTQPFPTRPPPFARQGVSLDDANDLTPEIKALAQAEMKKYRLGPLFTPPSLRGTLQLPGNEGGANWGGAMWDAQAGPPLRPQQGRDQLQQRDCERRHRQVHRPRLLRDTCRWRARHEARRHPAHQAARTRT